jgi:hypothetical protein
MKIRPMAILLTMLADWINRQQTGIKTVKISSMSPNTTPYAERFIRTIKAECLEKMLILSESHLRYIVSIYCNYYYHRRPNQGLDNNMIEPLPQDEYGKIFLEKQLGGLFESYRRVA